MMKTAGSGSIVEKHRSADLDPDPHQNVIATLKNTVNSKPESGNGHGAAHVEVFVQPEAEMSLAGAHHEARGPASHNIVVLTRPTIHLRRKNLFF